MTRWLLAALLSTTVPSVVAAPAPPTVVRVVRHAEKAPGTGDVPLSEAGVARAAAIAGIGRVAGVEAIITTQFARTRQTGATLASSLGITPEVVPATADLAKHAADVVAAVRHHAGQAVLVVGHSNTVPAIVAALGGGTWRDLCEAEYDVLFTVVIPPDGPARTIKSRFGVPTPVGEGCAPMR